MWALWNLPNVVTISGLVLGLATCLLALEGLFFLAAVTLIGSGICDLFDGFIARKVSLPPEARRFGAELDTVVDACSFGLAPAVFLYGYGLQSWPELILLGIYLWAACWRLAWFDAFGMVETEDAAYYNGLPVTFAALFLPLGFAVVLVAEAWARPVLAGLALLLAGLMVSGLPIKKPRGLWYPVLLGMAVVMVAVYLYAHLGG